MRSGLAADRMGWDATRLSRVERGLYRVSPDEVRRFAAMLEVDDPAAVEEVAAVAEEPPGAGWWAPYAGRIGSHYLDFIELEAEARTIRIHHPVVIPGPLQSPGYAREILTEAASREQGRAEMLVNIRVARQEILTRNEPVHIHALVPESALHARFGGGPNIMREQLHRLLDVSEMSNVTLQIVPLTAHPAYVSKGPVTLLGFRHPWVPVASVDNPMGGSHTEDPEQVEYLEGEFGEIVSIALSVSDSREILTEYLEGLHK